MRISFILLTLLFAYFGWSQKTEGTVVDQNNEPLIGASILLLQNESKNPFVGTTTDAKGQFSLESSIGEKLIVSFIGFKNDTITVSVNQNLKVVLAPDDEELTAVVVSSSSTFMDDLTPIHTEVITEKELLRAACCNLSESFETNASVDVSYTDAVTGTKMIRMLGLDGKYTSINRENMPGIRGLNVRAGLNYIPGTWLQSIDVGKGAGSVLNGYESMTGQINLELKKPESSELLYLNTYVNSFGRVEQNVNTSFEINDRVSSALLIHTNYFNNELDINGDNFLDLPKSKQINVLNRYKYHGDHIESQWGVHLMRDEKAGGQLGFGFGDDALTSPLYGYANEATRAELFGKLGILYPHAPYKGFGFIYSLAVQNQNSDFGRRRYEGVQKTIYTNLIHQNIIGSTIHQYKIGTSCLADIYDETFADSTFSRNEIVPGSFFEYTYKPNERTTLVLGHRIDFHSLYGIYQSPRLHFRYQLADETTLRLAAGKGYRTANIILENGPSFISSRALMVTEPLEPEESWTFGGSLVKEINIGSKKVNLVTDYFYTNFTNQVIADLDASPQQIKFYNLDGRSFASSFQIEGSYQISEHLSSKMAYKYYDVKATINNKLQALPMVSKHRLFLNMGYASRFDKWKADLTAQWYGASRLPNTSANPQEFQRADYSPDFVMVNAQVSRTFRWGNVYLGSENLLGLRQSNPIIDAESPFGNNFDASMAWGPIAGRMIFAGVRYKIQKR
ncbi:MAG: outer membrane receptor for ferrienterochelin and colicins [Marinoscillum sp.]|jgi:outer membrane receptor for ferrienterochelin and colicins